MVIRPWRSVLKAMSSVIVVRSISGGPGIVLTIVVFGCAATVAGASAASAIATRNFQLTDACIGMTLRGHATPAYGEAQRSDDQSLFAGRIAPRPPGPAFGEAHF